MVLPDLFKNNRKFDFIYVDGSHECLQCYADLVNSHNLINTSGIIAIDDYMWTPSEDNIPSPMDDKYKFSENVRKIYL